MANLIGNAPINRLLRGFLDFFDVQSFGQNPRMLGETVQPTFEMADWYADPSARYESFAYPVMNVNADAANLAGGLQVPNDEIWFVNSLWAQALFSAGAVSPLGGFRPAVILPNAATPSPWHLPVDEDFYNIQNMSATVITQYISAVTRKFLAPPGSRLTISHNGFAFGASTLTFQISAMVIRCRA